LQKRPWHQLPDHLPHHRIERKTICIIHIIISRQSTEDRLAQQTN
jgi:hypothetical protein